MKVWIVSEFDGEANYVQGVFSSEEKAKEYIKYHGGSEFSTDEYEVDEPFSKDESYWAVTMRMSKRPSLNMIKCEKDMLRGKSVDSFVFYKYNPNEVMIYVKAKTMDDAIEESNRRIERIIDEKEGLFKKPFTEGFTKFRRIVNYLTGEYIDD